MNEQNQNQDDIELENIASEEADSEIDTARYKIKTYGADFTLELLSKKIDDKEIVIPKFQRRYVWNIKKASKLIESFLLGLPVPQVFLYREEESQDLLVVDGQQRLRTINFYLKGIFDNAQIFKLKGVRDEWEGKTFAELNASDQRKLKNYILRANIFEQTDPQDNSSVFEIFERLNTGGMALTPQEIRNCVIRGGISDFLTELNMYAEWRNILKKGQPDTRMKDIELILRFFALYEKKEQYKKPMNDFISEFMRSKKDLTEEMKNQYKQLFQKIVTLINKEIPENPFRIKTGINIAVFDSVMVGIATVGPDTITDFKKKYDNLLKDQEYLESVSKSTTDTERVKDRITKAIKYLST
ncbi:MAG: hypothetical protein COU31_02800 [Candidatus Magasanikbacteria bacterium CG10_big_fil_rev_8_21_14_0_10_40_10]|uniref:GmrSD restriction endonucleases N-terminal domain-containing protein n=1 Tax=Candidatus Magasanikbacteria bacterium CG10_big_fil_rev_8_21_14_0_10_40_10 TaxID=1974648 RepID=A0A2M6W3V4_9BACT|nr:MAG: hypothetical protein COU31_02800 [Candidatus Magasanikbacteria bacterium CG10_big_fil_rev_8_21_14_0_10_40_10]